LAVAKRQAPPVAKHHPLVPSFVRHQALPVVELYLPHGPLRLAGPRCGRREHTVDMGAVGGVPGMGEEMWDLLEWWIVTNFPILQVGEEMGEATITHRLVSNIAIPPGFFVEKIPMFNYREHDDDPCSV
jgi:hypothetical protein